MYLSTTASGGSIVELSNFSLLGAWACNASEGDHRNISRGPWRQALWPSRHSAVLEPLSGMSRRGRNGSSRCCLFPAASIPTVDDVRFGPL